MGTKQAIWGICKGDVKRSRIEKANFLRQTPEQFELSFWFSLVYSRSIDSKVDLKLTSAN